MTKCPKCGAELDAGQMKAKRCKCGFEFPPDEGEKEKEKAKKAEEDKLAGEKAAADKSAAESLDALAKAHAATRTQLEETMKANVKLAADLAVEVMERKRRDAVAKAAKEFPSLKLEDTADLLLKAEAVGSEFLGKLETTLKQAEAMAKAGGALREIGSPGELAGAGAFEQIQKAADAWGQRTGLKGTPEQRQAAFLSTPEGLVLHRAYRAAQQ